MIPYESDAAMADREIIEGLVEITALSISDVLVYELTYSSALFLFRFG